MSDRMIHVIEDLLAGVLAVLLGIYLCACWAEAAEPEAREIRNQGEQGVLSTQDSVLRQSGAPAAGSEKRGSGRLVAAPTEQRRDKP